MPLHENFSIAFLGFVASLRVANSSLYTNRHTPPCFLVNDDFLLGSMANIDFISFVYYDVYCKLVHLLKSPSADGSAIELWGDPRYYTYFYADSKAKQGRPIIKRNVI